MKELSFKIIAFFLAIFLIYLVLFFFIFLKVAKIKPNHFNSLKQIDFHKKYSSKIHHIRDMHALNNLFKKDQLNDLLFTKINEISEKEKIVLLQGDSWMDQIVFSHDKNYPSLKLLQEYGLEKKIEFINGGTSSFSPSLMNLQLDILEEDFEIFPNIVIAYIDQTDIGDENCRYKSRKIFSNGKLSAVKPESYSHTIWDYTRIYDLVRISISYQSKIIRTFHILNFRLNHGFMRLITKIKKKIENNFRKNEVIKCHMPIIENYLINSTKDQVDYFSNTVENYLKKLESKKHIKKIFLITFPHKKHLIEIENETTYRLNVSEIVENATMNSKKATHINFSNSLEKIILNNNKYNFENIWKNDNIHLKSEAHADIFINNILKELNNYLQVDNK